MRKLLATLVFPLALVACLAPISNIDQEILALRAEVSADARLNTDEKINLGKTLDAATADNDQAKSLASLDTPPLDRVTKFKKSAVARCQSVRVYLDGEK